MLNIYNIIKSQIDMHCSSLHLVQRGVSHGTLTFKIGLHRVAIQVLVKMESLLATATISQTLLSLWYVKLALLNSLNISIYYVRTCMYITGSLFKARGLPGQKKV